MRAATLLFVCVSAAGCGDDDTVPAPVAPPIDERVVSYQMTTTIAAGVEAEHCKFVQAPPEGLLINQDDVRYSEGSHHVLLYDTNYEEIPTKATDGSPLPWIDESTGVFDCTEGVLFSLDARQMIAGSQNFDGDSAVDLPPGVAVRIQSNAVLLLNAHYINGTGADLHPEVTVDLHTIPEEELVAEGGVLFHFDIFLKASALGSTQATMTCDLGEDITITNAQSHMHARGVGFDAVLIGPDGERETFYESSDWSNVPVERFAEGLTIPAGSRIEHSCFYENPAEEDVYMGPRSTDEMCVLIASYYPARAELGLCSGKAAEPFLTNFMGAEWEGQGTVSCSDSLGCFSEATGASGGIFDITAGITECVMAADPAVAPELSAAIGCSLSAFLTGGDPFEECGEAYADCSAL